MSNSLFVLRELRVAQINRFNDYKYDGTVAFGEIKKDGAEVPNLDNCSANYRLMSAWGVFFLIIKKSYCTIEINEPFFLRSLNYQAAVWFAVWISKNIFFRKTKVVCYAIENMDVILRSRNLLPIFGRGVEYVLKFFLGVSIGGIDKIAFGTLAAENNYKKYFSEKIKKIDTRLVDSLEPICEECCDLIKNKINMKFVFLGAFDDRKGIEHVMNIWPKIRAAYPDASLNIIGDGPKKNQIFDWASKFDEVKVYVAPSAEIIHGILSESVFLFLLSNETKSWKEQIGLPILEGLSHGCWIISSDSTGISGWLEKNNNMIISTESKNFADEVIKFIASKDGKIFDAKNILPKFSGRKIANDFLHHG